MKRIAILPFFLFLSPHSVAAEEIYQFAMFHSGTMVKEDCALVERYSPADDQTTKFPGLLTGKGCEVILSKKVYEKKFRFCYLAGVNLYKTSNADMIECFIQMHGEEYSFLATAEDSTKNDGQVMCYFTCIGNDVK